MLTSLALVFATTMVSADVRLVPDTQLNYRGSIEQRGGEEGAKSRKAFDLTMWVAKSGPAGSELFWLLEEKGRGAWPWTQRFGRLSLDAAGKADSSGPSLLYDRGEAQSVVPLPAPVLAAEKTLAADASWEEGKLSYHVDKMARRADRDVWQISVRDAFGPKRQVWVDPKTSLVAAASERVIMGRGDEYELKMELVGSESLAAPAAAKIVGALNSLLALRGKLNPPPDSQELNWKPEQLKVLGEQLPDVKKSAAETPLVKLVDAADRDLGLQTGRSGAVTELSDKYVGQIVQKFSIKGLGDESLTDEKLRGRVTVLHFWDYRDEPLKEPYGQIGYLDFMYHRRKAAGLQVYGIAVDGRLGDEKTRGAAERGVKKLKAFMNLSYPLLFDSGPLIKQFGDPRVLGATLPLFVVVGPNGKILHYHVGHYEVSQDQGLKELDQVVAAALEKK
jgi:hypothetical protein